MDGEEFPIADGFAVVVPAGTQHNVINKMSDKSMKLYTIYMPPHHRDGTTHRNKEDALNDTEDHI
jgi:mannose-6-phosphate isomerase-like protein (cupin superfamily)